MTSPSTRRLLRAGLALPAAALLALAAGCGPDDEAQDVRSAVSFRDARTTSETPAADGGADDAGTTTTTSTTTETATATTTLDPEEPGSGEDREFGLSTRAERADGYDLGIADVRIGAHEGYDRVVVELVGDGDAGWNVRYEDSPAQPGSGLPVGHPGDQALVLDVTGTGYPFELDIEDLTVGEVHPRNTAAIVEVAGYGMFEGQTQYVISLKGEKRPFRVFRLSSPQRIVIDVETAD